MLAAISGAHFATASWASDPDEERLPVPEPAERCVSCHALTPDEPPLVGPTLWQVVGRPVASVPGFEYSAALKALGGVWTRARLDQFLTAPQSFAPGTKMELGGVRHASDRDLVLDFLETLKPASAGSSATGDRETLVAESSGDAPFDAAQTP
jgi:cytochrome c2